MIPHRTGDTWERNELPPRKMNTGVEFGRIVDLLRFEVTGRLGIKEVFLEQHLTDPIGHVLFNLTEKCQLNIYIELEEKEERFPSAFGRRILQELFHEKITSDILAKLLPHCRVYCITFSALSGLWSDILYPELDRQLESNIKTFQWYKEINVNPLVYKSLKNKLIVKQKEIYETHMNLFQLFARIGSTISFLNTHWKSLLFIINNNPNDYRYLEFIFTREERFFYYFHHQNSAYRDLFFLLFSGKIFLLLSITSLYPFLPELRKEIFWTWFSLLIIEEKSPSQK